MINSTDEKYKRIIRKLIISNASTNDSKITLFYGIYKLSYNSNKEKTLADAVSYFINSIYDIEGFDNEYNV